MDKVYVIVTRLPDHYPTIRGIYESFEDARQAYDELYRDEIEPSRGSISLAPVTLNTLKTDWMKI